MTGGTDIPSGQRLLVEIVHDSGSWAWLGDSTGVAETVAGTLGGAALLPSRLCAATVVLASDALVHDLNRDWRRQDKPTNVLSFPSPRPAALGDDAAEVFVGDVVLAEETVLREATEQSKAASDHFRHLVLHGLLHLIGFDHETQEEACRMEALETRLLAGLGVADPYADTEPMPPH